MAVEDKYSSVVKTFDEVQKELLVEDEVVVQKKNYDLLDNNYANTRYENLQSYRAKLYKKSVKLDSQRIISLRHSGHITEQDISAYVASRKVTQLYRGALLRLHSTNKESEADSHIEIITENPEERKRRTDIPTSSSNKLILDIVNDEDVLIYEDMLRRTNRNTEFLGKKNIKVRDWKLEDGELMNYSNEFYNWINSINGSFKKQIGFYKFQLYKQQARQWLSQTANNPFNPFAREEERLAWLGLERAKMRSNTLYAVMTMLKPNLALTRRKNLVQGYFKPHPVQELIMYLYDLYLCILCGKARQIGTSTILLAASLIRTMLNAGYLTKFTSEKKDKAEEIFKDKGITALSSFPNYMVPTIKSDDGLNLEFAVKTGKGKREGANSQFKIEAPYDSFINGGTPNESLIDEIGFVDNLSAIIEQGLTTLYYYNPETQRLELERQCFAWGTGGKMKAPMRNEWKATKERWLDKDFTGVFIPVFLDAWARPGFSLEFYEAQRKYYYAKNDEKSKVVFHQTYCLNEDDMFLTSSETVLPHDEINFHIGRTENNTEKMYGFFKPIYDMSKPLAEGSFVPYRIKGAEFVRTKQGSEVATAIVYTTPERGWVNRWFQGSDPIISSTGHSKNASAIWDAYNKEQRISAIVNFRTKPNEDVKYNYLQSYLMGRWYNPAPLPHRHLIEINAGQYMIEWIKDVMLDGYSLVSSKKLIKPFSQDVGGWGIRKDSRNARFIVYKLQELLEMYSGNINSLDFWKQLKTYVKYEYKNSIQSSDLSFAYRPENKKFDYDDVIDAIIYSYICYLCYEYLTPKKTSEQGSKSNVQHRMTRDRQGNLIMQKVRIFAPDGTTHINDNDYER